MLTTIPFALPSAARNCSRYLGSVEGKCPVQGSILLILNFSMMWAAKSFRSSGLADLLSFPVMKLRKGYDAIAIRSRGWTGNCRLGVLYAANTDLKPEQNRTPAAVAHCARNRRRVGPGKLDSVAEGQSITDQLLPSTAQESACLNSRVLSAPLLEYQLPQVAGSLGRFLLVISRNALQTHI